METVVKLRRLRPDKSRVPLPSYATAGSSGLDLYADIDSELTLAPLERRKVPTGIALELAPGFEGQIRARSGRALAEGLTVINGPGTIDADYRGEVMVLLVNLGTEPVTIRPGDRIAQLVIAPVARARIVEVQELGASGRGDGGFGHTGR